MMWERAAYLLLALAVALGASALRAAEDRAAERERMVREQIAARDVSDQHVLAALRAVPRHEFVPAHYRDQAYDDGPLPIGHGQTISQPYVVALMSAVLALDPHARVLEVGTGSGYQAAVLRQLTDDVYTIEIIAPLRERAAAVLARHGVPPDRVIAGDGYLGLPAAAPFDAIIVTAAADHVPPPLLAQLKPGGRMVIPIGPVYGPQRLVLIEKDSSGGTTTRSLLPVAFVPLTRAE